MIGLFDRYFLVRAARTNSGELVTDVTPEPSRDSFILDWSLDGLEAESVSAEETAAERGAMA
jgi:hypothetical protein